MTARRLDKPVVVLEVVEPGKLPEHCVHGRAACIACPEWVWLGHETVKLVQSGEALPMCRPCAIKHIPPDTKPVGHVQDHQRADGPHE